MKWRITALCAAALAVFAAVYYMRQDEAARKVKTEENIKAIDHDYAILISDPEMKIAVLHGALCDYANNGARLYFKFGSQKVKLNAQDKALVDALHKCAHLSDIPVPGKEQSWMADSQCVQDHLRQRGDDSGGSPTPRGMN
jgi:hypothetical protein